MQRRSRQRGLWVSVRVSRACAAAACAVVLGSALLSCTSSGSADDKPSSSGSPSATSSSAPSDGSTVEPSPTKKPSQAATSKTPKVPDPVLESYVPVKRGGQAPKPTISSKPAAFDGTVRYDDGLSLEVTSIKQGKITGKGPGVFVGQPFTRIALSMTNGGARAVSLNQVVVTAIYGVDRRQARPVYDNETRDFSGTLGPDDVGRARYTFSIPKDQLTRVTMIVDFDGRHTVARFDGVAR